jgi:hypothetical protein
MVALTLGLAVAACGSRPLSLIGDRVVVSRAAATDIRRIDLQADDTLTVEIGPNSRIAISGR